MRPELKKRGVQLKNVNRIKLLTYRKLSEDFLIDHKLLHLDLEILMKKEFGSFFYVFLDDFR